VGFDKKDAAKETDCTPKGVSKAWHQARDDAASSGELEERNDNKNNDSENGKIIRSIIKSFFSKDDE